MVQNHVSYRLNDPDAYLIGAPDENRTRQRSLDRRVSPPEDGEGTKERTWRWCAEEDSHLHSHRPRGYGPLGSLLPKPARGHRQVILACHAYSVFKVLTISGQKKKGLALARPFVD
jgi:hypothetical protein